MNYARQLSLFPPSPAVFSPRFARWSRKVDELRICACCGREIILKARGKRSEIVGELISAGGECRECAQ